MWWMALAWAEEPREEPPEEPAPAWVIELPAPEEPLPSALDTLDQIAEAHDAEDLEALRAELEAQGLDPDDFMRPALVRGRWTLRPQLSYTSLIGDDTGSGMRVGVVGGREWWTMPALPVQLAAAVKASVTAPVLGARGLRLGGSARIGPWLGPVSLQVGPTIRHDRETWSASGVELVPSTYVGAGLTAATDVGIVQVLAGVEPAWRVGGARLAASSGDPLLPVIGHETAWIAGVGLPLGPLRTLVRGTWRETSVGSVLDVGLSVQIAPRSKTEDAPLEVEEP